MEFATSYTENISCATRSSWPNGVAWHTEAASTTEREPAQRDKAEIDRSLERECVPLLEYKYNV